MLEKVFKLKEHNTDVKTELLAGLTTFLAMVYILSVNASILGDAGMSQSGVVMATALASAIACFVMGILANYPVALSAGLGVNAVFAYTIVLSMGLSYQGALACVFISGIIFIAISVTGIRALIINAIPQQLKIAIGAGIGFFIAFIGLNSAGIVTNQGSTVMALGDFSNPVVLLGLFGIIITICFLVRGKAAGVFYGMVITAVVGIILGMMGIEGMPTLPASPISTDFDFSLIGAFKDGFADVFSNPQCWVAIFSLLFVDFFDTAGTLVAVASSAGLVNEDGSLDNIDKALLADAIGTVVGAMLGTSTVTSFVESTSGVKVGGRTGLTACTTGVLFIVSILFAPIFLSCFSSCGAVTCPALFAVGILMSQGLKNIKWDDFSYAATAFVTVIVMTLGYSITNGIALGFITYAVCMAIGGRLKEVKPIVWGLIVCFVLYFIFLV